MVVAAVAVAAVAATAPRATAAVAATRRRARVVTPTAARRHAPPRAADAAADRSMRPMTADRVKAPIWAHNQALRSDRIGHAMPRTPTPFAPPSTAWPNAAAGNAAADAPAGRVALVAGASGLVGRALLTALTGVETGAGGYRAVHALVRRPLGLQAPGLSEQVVDFAALPALPPIDDVYIALGTTIAVAGSQAAFRAVDFDAVLAVAQAAQAAGASRLGVVSAMGADPRSRIFYNRVKGEMEQALSAMDWPTLVIVRPSLLLGERAALGQPGRPAERVSALAMRLLADLIPSNYRAVPAVDVAATLVAQVQRGAPGRHILLSGALQRGSPVR